jgi:hypothetical protein
MNPTNEVLTIPLEKSELMRYLRVLHKEFAFVSSDDFDAVFMVWCVQIVKSLTIDNNTEILNYNLYNALMNTLNNILYLSKSHILFQDEYMKGLEEILNTCRSLKNGILIEEIMNEYHMHKCEHERVKRESMRRLKDELLKRVWHPMRILKKMEAYNLDPVDM